LGNLADRILVHDPIRSSAPAMGFTRDSSKSISETVQDEETVASLKERTHKKRKAPSVPTDFPTYQETADTSSSRVFASDMLVMNQLKEKEHGEMSLVSGTDDIVHPKPEQRLSRPRSETSKIERIASPKTCGKP